MGNNSIDNRIIIGLLFDGYKKRKMENRLYSKDDRIPKIIISEYLNLVERPSFNKFISLYKRNYILCESKVEPNFSIEEQQGLADTYDYINDFDFSKDEFNVFTTSLIIHMKLFSHCGDGSFGGSLRDSTAVLNDVNIDVVPPHIAKKVFNSYIPKKDYILEKYKKGDIFGYIEDCIKLNVELIKLQPFADGNKRTFRSLLNLQLKLLNIPPIYIPAKERQEYKKVLIKAIRDDDFKDIIQFYYYKICDAIITLDIKHSEILENNDIKKNTL